MRRIGVIVALGALLSMIAGAVTAAPALAVGGRGDGWVFQDFGPGFTTTTAGSGSMQRRTSTTYSPSTHDRRRVHDLPVHRRREDHLREPGKRKERQRQHVGSRENHRECGRYPPPFGRRDASQSTSRQPMQQLTGLPAPVRFAGPVTATVDAAGNITSVNVNGHMLVNMCAALS